MRLTELIGEATAALAAAHVASPRVDAELLAAFVIGVPRSRLLGAPNPTPAQVRQFRQLVTERAARRPLQHLTGTAPFRHLVLRVGHGVFVPRPETERLVEWGLGWLRDHPAQKVVDLCAGSGAIALSIATESRASSAPEPVPAIWAVEWDAAALEWLRRNVADAPVTVVAGDVTDPGVLSELDGTVDLVLCNPPYVPEIGAAGLPPEVSDHDPHSAVFGGTDGLEVIRPLISRVAALLRPGGAFAVEHDDTHAYVVPTLIDADGRFTDVELRHDLARRPRFTTATRADRPL